MTMAAKVVSGLCGTFYAVEHDACTTGGVCIARVSGLLLPMERVRCLLSNQPGEMRFLLVSIQVFAHRPTLVTSNDPSRQTYPNAWIQCLIPPTLIDAPYLCPLCSYIFTLSVIVHFLCPLHLECSANVWL